MKKDRTSKQRGYVGVVFLKQRQDKQAERLCRSSLLETNTAHAERLCRSSLLEKTGQASIEVM